MTDDELITRYIGANPNRPGPEHARLEKYGVPVWAIISYLDQAANGDVARVASDYDVPVEAVEAARVYYRRHAAAIDARIAATSTDDPDVREATFHHPLA